MVPRLPEGIDKRTGGSVGWIDQGTKAWGPKDTHPLTTNVAERGRGPSIDQCTSPTNSPTAPTVTSGPDTTTGPSTHIRI